MLQAVQPDSSPAPAKPRSGTDNGSDPALAVFAGMMAQAATPARTPETQPPAERSEPRDTARAVEPAEARKATERVSDAKGAEAEAPAGKTGSAMKSQDETSKAGEPQATDTQAGQKAATPTPQTPSPAASADIPKTASSQPEPTPIVANAPSAPAPEQPQEAAGTKSLPALPKELKVAVEGSAEPTGSRPQAALRELLHLPKVEVETPQLQPEKPAKAQVGPVAASAQAETGGDTAPVGADETAPVEGAAKPASPATNHAVLVKPEATEIATPQASTPKGGTPEGALLPAAEPVRTTPATVHAEAPAPVRPNPVASQVEGSIRWILQNKSQGAELQLHPESLGRVVIQLKVEGQEVHARLWASENASLAVLQDHKAFLETSLKDQGLTLSTFDLQSGARGNSAQTAFQEQTASSPRTLPHLEVKQEMPTELRLDPADPYRVEVYA